MTQESSSAEIIQSHLCVDGHWKPFIATKCYKCIEDKDEKDLNLLVGAKVTEVLHFEAGYGDSGFILKFDNGLFLTAQDGEDGVNALRFFTEKEAEDKLRMTPIFLNKQKERQEKR